MPEPPDNANNSLLSSLSVEEAAAALRVSGQTVRRRLKRGELRGEKIIGPTGSEWRVYREGTLAIAQQAVVQSEQAPFRVIPADPLIAALRESLNDVASLRLENEQLRAEVVLLKAQQAQQVLPAPRRPWWRVKLR